MPAIAHHGGNADLWEVCLPAGDIGRSPCKPRIIAHDRTVESHAGIGQWRSFRLHVRRANGWPREDLNEIDLRLRVVSHAGYRQLSREQY
jgi:hypothetical protein